MSQVFRGSTLAYFDCNATTPTLPSAAQAAVEAMQSLYGNPSSSHLVGLQARTILEGARSASAQVLGVQPESLIFTSGATEAIQLAVFSALSSAQQRGIGARNQVLYAATEHKAVPQALKHWVKALSLPVQGVELPVDSQGQLLLEPLRQALPHALLLCTMAVNNETGVIQNLDAIAEARRLLAPSCLWLVDSVQALGKVPLRLLEREIDYAPFSGHKFYAPKGIGLLYARAEAPLVPMMVGGGQERGLRSGTENLPGVAAFGAIARELLIKDGPSPFHAEAKLREFRDRIAAALKGAFPEVVLNTPLECSVPTTLNFSVPGLSSRELLDVFDSAGVRLSAGSACSSASVEPSYVLDAMGVPEWRSISAVRLSFGPLTSEEEVERGCRAIREAAMALQGSCLLQTGGGYEAPEGLRDGVIQLRSGPANTWIVADKAARTCAVIDPTETTVERIVNYIRCQGLRVMAVLDTHSHADHDSTRPLLLRALEDQLSEGAQNGDALGWPAQTERAPLADGSEAEVLVFSPTRWLARVATPGHTSDSVKFLWGEGGVQELRSQHAVRFAFVGDTVWSGGLGRTNFAMSDATALYHSLHKLTAILGESTLLCSAHDYDTSFATTLALEARENPLLQKVVSEALDEFVAEKARLDEQLAELERSFQGVMCGVTAERAKQDEQALKLQLSQALKESNLEWIDVREPHEHVLFKGWREAGILNPPRNVPLSRFVNFMQEALRKDSASRKFVLVCRSGNRSLQAAKTLRRMGHSQVWSLDGGVATL